MLGARKTPPATDGKRRMTPEKSFGLEGVYVNARRLADWP